MEKIYSRKRFIIKPFRQKNSRKSKKYKIKRKILKILSIIIIGSYSFKTILNYIEPVYETLCYEKAKSIATIITNQQSTIFMNKYQYDELYTIEKDPDGNITLIKANVTPINNMISDLTENIQKEFDKVKKEKIYITIGNITGNNLISGFGPQIPITIATTGTVETEIKSEFISEGINQTLHRVYVVFNCQMSVVATIKKYSQNITNQFIIAENVIIGNIPETYYNLNGLQDPIDTINLMD